jgi:hypothetical protein
MEKIALAVLAVAVGLYVRLWLLKSQGEAVHLPFFGRKPGK